MLRRPSYSDLDMQDVPNPDALWICLATRRDLMSLTHILCVPAWPSAQTWAYIVARVFAWVDNRRSLSLPSHDLHILRQHSAFGLRDIQLGDTNVVSLRFPFLLDDDDDALPPT
ncbi:uncharacterized protein ARMOST_21548 [Armillaria ostoyae]|uniref:Uncharacterized protein n=1 Tax=Armillaria ostoyae TaxID=47428 RepID=A0A284SAD8_ARMOS|nr:uncharacterized protein ARMOST_21548 [Armillaria ostoyae]